LFKPIVSVSLKGNCTLGILGEEILRAAGYPIADGSTKPSQLWNSLSRRLGHRKVYIVHIDETQHLIKNTEKASDRKALANALKGVMNDDYWPVSFIVSGLPSNDVDCLLQDLKGSKTTKQISKSTHIPIVHLRHLVRSGGLNAIENVPQQNFGKAFISRDSVESLKRRLFSGAETVERKGQRQVPVCNIVKLAAPAVLQALMSGALWRGLLQGRRDYRALLVNSDEVDALLARTEAISGLKGPDISVYIIGMGKPGRLISEGHLRVKKEFCHTAYRTLSVVTRESAKRFKDTYVSTKEVAQSVGHHHRYVYLKLTRAGIAPIFPANEYGTDFYRSSAIDRALSKVPGFWRK
jgi:hypothetical protein